MRNDYYFGRNIEDALTAEVLGGRCVNFKGAFDFVEQISKGKCLLIGEGNLSFTRSLLIFPSIVPEYLTATTFESYSDLGVTALDNQKALIGKSVRVFNGVNGRHIENYFPLEKFETIVFQFPHRGKRPSLNGRNPNFYLIRDFLKSARKHLKTGGCVCITAVDSPHYDGAFNVMDSARIAGYNAPHKYPFTMNLFRGYEHTMTHDDASALRSGQKYSTWVFKPHE